MKKISKHMEVSCQSLGAAMFMATVCFYMIIYSIITWVSNYDYLFFIPFAFLIQGVITSMSASIIWTLLLSIKSIIYLMVKILLCSLIIFLMLGVSIFIPVINSSNGYLIWILSSMISFIGFGVLLAVFSERYYKKTGIRSVLIWEIQ